MSTSSFSGKGFSFILGVILTVIALYFYKSCEDKSVKISSNLKKHLITKEQSSILEKEYTTKKWDSLDSRIFSIKLDVLESYINYVKEKAKEDKNAKDLGILVCLAAYPEEGYKHMARPEYAGYQTIVFSPIKNTSDFDENFSLETAENSEPKVATRTAKKLNFYEPAYSISNAQDMNMMGATPPR